MHLPGQDIRVIERIWIKDTQHVYLVVYLKSFQGRKNSTLNWSVALNELSFQTQLSKKVKKKTKKKQCPLVPSAAFLTC